MIQNKDSNSATADDWVEQALAADGREHRAAYLADDGFTARVVMRLPQPAKLPAWRTPALALLWSAAAISIAMVLPGVVADITREMLRLVGAHPISLSGIAMGLIALGAATWASAAIVLRTDD